MLSDDVLFEPMLATVGVPGPAASNAEPTRVATNANRRLRKEAGIVFSFLRREEGQGLAEYAIIGSLIAVLAVLALTFIGSTLFKVLSVVGQGV